MAGPNDPIRPVGAEPPSGAELPETHEIVSPDSPLPGGEGVGGEGGVAPADESDPAAAGEEARQAAAGLSAIVSGARETVAAVGAESESYSSQTTPIRQEDVFPYRIAFRNGEGDHFPIHPADPETVGLEDYRRTEIDRVLEALKEGSRVVVVTGQPGAGKTEFVAASLKELLGAEGSGFRLVPLHAEDDNDLATASTTSVVVFDEANDPIYRTQRYQRLRKVWDAGGKIVFVGGAGRTPDDQIKDLTHYAGWQFSVEPQDVVEVRLIVKPFNRKQIEQMLFAKNRSLSDEERKIYADFVLERIPALPRALLLLALPDDIRSLAEAFDHFRTQFQRKFLGEDWENLFFHPVEEDTWNRILERLESDSKTALELDSRPRSSPLAGPKGAPFGGMTIEGTRDERPRTDRKIKGVILDLYRTLLWVREWRDAYEKLLSRVEHPPTYAELMTQHFKSPEAFLESLGDLPDGVADEFLDNLRVEIETTELYPEVMEVLMWLFTQGYRVALVSNLASPYHVSVDKLGLSHFFSAIIYSDEAGIMKPDPLIFGMALTAMGLAADEVVVVGDSITDDMKGAEAAGIQGIHLDRQGRKEYSPRISDLTVLRDYLEAVNGPSGGSPSGPASPGRHVEQPVQGHVIASPLSADEAIPLGDARDRHVVPSESRGTPRDDGRVVGAGIATAPFSWNEDDVIRWIRALPTQLRKTVLEWVPSTLNQAAYVMANLTRQAASGEFDGLVSLIRSVNSKLVELRHFAEAGPGPVGGEDDRADTLEIDLPKIFSMARELEQVSETLSIPSLPPATPRQVTRRAVSDVGTRLGEVVVAFTEYNWQNWVARVSLIKAYLGEFDDLRVLISVNGHLMPRLVEILADNLTAKEFDRVDFAIRSLTPTRGTSMWGSWARDGFMAFTGGGKGDELEASPFVLNQSPELALVLGLDVNSPRRVAIPAYEGGQYLIGRDVAIVGVGELFKMTQGRFFDPKDRERGAQKMADWLGKRVVFVGDPVRGQALHHVDLYMTWLPDGTVAVSDFGAGWELIDRMSDDDLAAWEGEYRQALSDAKENLPHFGRETAEVEDFLAEMRKPDSPLRNLMAAWGKKISGVIEREIEQLRAAGLTVHRVPAVPIPAVAGGLTYTNITVHRNERGEEVMFLPSYGKALDGAASGAYRSAGFSGKIVFVPFMAHSSLASGGTQHCMTFFRERADGNEPPHPLRISANEALSLKEAVNRQWQKVMDRVLSLNPPEEEVLASLERVLGSEGSSALKSVLDSFIGKADSPGERGAMQQKAGAILSTAALFHLIFRKYSPSPSGDSEKSRSYWVPPVVLAIRFHALGWDFPLTPASALFAMEASMHHLAIQSTWQAGGLDLSDPMSEIDRALGGSGGPATGKPSILRKRKPPQHKPEGVGSLEGMPVMMRRWDMVRVTSSLPSLDGRGFRGGWRQDHPLPDPLPSRERGKSVGEQVIRLALERGLKKAARVAGRLNDRALAALAQRGRLEKVLERKGYGWAVHYLGPSGRKIGATDILLLGLAALARSDEEVGKTLHRISPPQRGPLWGQSGRDVAISRVPLGLAPVTVMPGAASVLTLMK